jgi:hypothetical protein
LDHSEIPVKKPAIKNLHPAPSDWFRRVIFPLRIKVGLSILVLFVLATNIVLVQDANRRFGETKDKDQVTLNEKRFAELRQAMKAGGVVGYISDTAPESKGYRGNFYLTQYALVPVIVTMQTDRQWVVGNFWKTGKVPTVAPSGRLNLWKDFRNGVALFQSKSE